MFALVIGLWWFVIRPLTEPDPADRQWSRVSTEFGLCASPVKTARKAGCVVDGDTLVIGFGPDRRRIRLIGYDAPELEGACAAESQVAIRARDFFHQWLTQGELQWSGGDDPPRDQYGRELRALRRHLPDGSFEYLSDTMISARLASESGWGGGQPKWCN